MVTVRRLPSNRFLSVADSDICPKFWERQRYRNSVRRTDRQTNNSLGAPSRSSPQTERINHPLAEWDRPQFARCLTRIAPRITKCVSVPWWRDASVHPYMYYHYFIFRFGYYSSSSQQRSTVEMNECINEYVSAWLASPLLCSYAPLPHQYPYPPPSSLSTVSVLVNAWKQCSATRRDPYGTAPNIPFTNEESMCRTR